MSEVSGTKVPDGWALVPLNDLGRWVGGGTPSKERSDYWSGGTIPWVSPKDMKVPKIESTEDLITPAAVEGSATQLVPAGSVLVVTRSGILQHTLPVAVSGRDVTVNQDLKVLIPHEGIEPDYVAHALRARQQDILHNCSKDGTTVQSIDSSALKSYRINLAPYRTQQQVVAKIDELFSQIDEGERNLKRVQKLLKQYRQSVLKAAVTGELTKDWRAKNAGRGESGADLLKRILKARREAWETAELAKMKAKGKTPKDDSWKKKYKEPDQCREVRPDWLPESWAWCSLDQLGQANRPMSYGVLQPGEHVEDGVPLIRVGDINDGQLDTKNLKKVDPNIAAQYKRTELQGRELLITLVGSIGRTAIAPLDAKGFNTARAVGVVPLTCLVVPEWVESWLRSGSVNAGLGAKAHEVARKTLNLEDVRNCGVGLPPAAEQTEIVEIIGATFDRMSRVFEISTDASQKAQASRQSILRAAFAGQLVPQDPNDEPASELLKRIAESNESDQGDKSTKSKTSSRGRKRRKSSERATA